MNKAFFLFLTLITVTGCSSYTLEDAKKEGAVVEGPGGPLHLDNLDQFIENANSSIEGKLRIVRYDDEGNPHIGEGLEGSIS